MVQNKKRKAIFILIPAIILVTFFTGEKLDFSPSQINEDLPGEDLNPKGSAYWEYYDAGIIIDELNPFGKWEFLKGFFDFIKGSGTFADPYRIENVSVDGAQNQAAILYIQNSRKYFVINNCTFHNASAGGLNAGIILQNTTNGIIENCNLSNNLANGLTIFGDSGNSTIRNNVLNNNVDHSILSYFANTTSIFNNTLNDNAGNGISLFGSNQMHVYNNSLNNTGDNAIIGFESNNSMIENNFINNSASSGFIALDIINFTIHNNDIRNAGIGSMVFESTLTNFTENNVYMTGSGLHSTNCTDLIYMNNYIVNSSGSAVSLDGTNSSIVFSNTIINHSTGISLLNNTIYNSSDNVVYLNYVYNCSDYYAVDNGTNNQWDNGTIGNYWQNYTGTDINDDFIGDLPYSINGSAGSFDNYPIFEDGDNVPPEMNIIEPLNFTEHTYAPNIILDINESYSYETWFQIDMDSTRYYFTGDQFTIENSTWNDLSPGDHTILIFCNDSIFVVNTSLIITILEIPGITPEPEPDLSYIWFFFSLIPFIFAGIAIYIKREDIFESER